MKDYHVVGIILVILIVFAISFEWYMFQRSRRATRENRCQLCGQTLPTKGSEEDENFPVRVDRTVENSTVSASAETLRAQGLNCNWFSRRHAWDAKTIERSH